MLPYIKIYPDFINVVQELDNGARGRLFLAIMQYANEEAPDELTGAERIAFIVLKGQIDRDADAYEANAKKQSENGKKGGRPKKATAFSENPKNPPVFSESHLKPKKPEKEKEEDKDKDKDKDEDKDKKKRADAKTDDFDAFWAVYPRKVGKGDAKKAFAKVKAPVSVLISAVNTQKQSQQWLKDNGQYIPNPATWLNQGRWEDELPTNDAAKGVVAHSEKASAQQLESLKEIYRKVKGEQR